MREIGCARKLDDPKGLKIFVSMLNIEKKKTFHKLVDENCAKVFTFNLKI